MQNKKKINVNVLLIGAVLVLGIGLFHFQKLTRKPGTTASVFIKEEKRMTIDLTVDEEYHIEADLPVTLEVKDGSIRFINSVCPDHLCEGFGYIHISDESAICLPAGVAVIVD